MPCPEQAQQYDFFEPRSNDDDKLQTLFSLLLQSRLKPGVYHIEPSILPEKSWCLKTDTLEVKRREAMRSTELSTSQVAEPEASYVAGAGPGYGSTVMQAPRPTRLLLEPRLLTLDELQKLKILSRNPIERLEGSWWQNKQTSSTYGPLNGVQRDYYFAVSPEGQCLWIYQDSPSEDYYLHGYFD